MPAGTCPRCGSTDTYRIEQGRHGSHRGGMRRLREGLRPLDGEHSRTEVTPARNTDGGHVQSWLLDAPVGNGAARAVRRVVGVLATLQASQAQQTQQTRQTPQAGVVTIFLLGFLRDRGRRGGGWPRRRWTRSRHPRRRTAGSR